MQMFDEEWKKKFTVSKSGQEFVRYNGLVDVATEKFSLDGIETTLIQLPKEDNNRTAVVQATAYCIRNGNRIAFQGLGDAAPNNVAPAMQVHIIRLAETRAKSRALRDMTNIGMTSFEELGVDADDIETTPTKTTTRNAAVSNKGAAQTTKAADNKGDTQSDSQGQNTQEKQATSPKRATDKQIARVVAIMQRKGQADTLPDKMTYEQYVDLMTKYTAMEDVKAKV